LKTAKITNDDIVSNDIVSSSSSKCQCAASAVVDVSYCQ